MFRWQRVACVMLCVFNLWNYDLMNIHLLMIMSLHFEVVVGFPELEFFFIRMWVLGPFSLDFQMNVLCFSFATRKLRKIPLALEPTLLFAMMQKN